MTLARRALTDRRVRLAVWLIGLAVVWIGYRVQSTPVILAGVVLATSGYWPALAPGRRYRGTVTAIMQQWQGALGSARDRFLAVRAQRPERLLAIPVPAACLEARDRLLGIMAEAVPETAGGVSEQIGQSIDERRAATEVLEELRERPGAQERAYAEAVGALLSEFSAELAGMTNEFERALSEAIARIEALSPPARLADAHRRLASSLRAEYIGLSAYNRAVHDLDLDAALAAVAELDRARALTKGAVRELGGS